MGNFMIHLQYGGFAGKAVREIIPKRSMLRKV